LRREFIDAHRADFDVSRTVERAEPFGLDLSTPTSPWRSLKGHER